VIARPHPALRDRVYFGPPHAASLGHAIDESAYQSRTLSARIARSSGVNGRQSDSAPACALRVICSVCTP